MDSQIHSLAQELYQQKSLLVMGRGYNYATCLEGALVIRIKRRNFVLIPNISPPFQHNINNIKC